MKIERVGADVVFQMFKALSAEDQQKVFLRQASAMDPTTDALGAIFKRLSQENAAAFLRGLVPNAEAYARLLAVLPPAEQFKAMNILLLDHAPQTAEKVRRMVSDLEEAFTEPTIQVGVEIGRKSGRRPADPEIVKRQKAYRDLQAQGKSSSQAAGILFKDHPKWFQEEGDPPSGATLTQRQKERLGERLRKYEQKL